MGRERTISVKGEEAREELQPRKVRVRIGSKVIQSLL